MEPILRTGDVIELDAPDDVLEEDCRVRGLVIGMTLLDDEQWDRPRTGIELLIGRQQLQDLSADLDRPARAVDHTSDGPQLDGRLYLTRLQELEQLGWERVRRGNHPAGTLRMGQEDR